MPRFFAILCALGTLFLATGCSSVLYKSGKPVDAFRGRTGGQWGKAASRAEVREKFGKPVATRSFAPAISVAEAMKLGLLEEEDFARGPGMEIPAFQSKGRIAHVDEYRIKGPTVLAGDYMKPGIALELAELSLGLSEVMLFPEALWDYMDRLNDVTVIYFFYDRRGVFLGQTRPERCGPTRLTASRLR